MKEDPSYKLYHLPSEMDGTRDKNGYWIPKNIIFDTKLKYADEDNLQFIMLANCIYCGTDPKYNWFCKLTKDEILKGKYFISKLFNKALHYNPRQKKYK